jgi:hypothetical protein
MKAVDTARLIATIERDEIPDFNWDPVNKKLDRTLSHMIRRDVSLSSLHRHFPHVSAVGALDSYLTFRLLISSRWSDGMGNPSGNSILECQLEQVQELVDSAAVSADLNRSPRRFWLDTLRPGRRFQKDE